MIILKLFIKIKVKITHNKCGHTFWQLPQNHLYGAGCFECYGSKKLTTEEFIKRAREVHGDKYDYSLVVYTHSHKKVTIICPIHGPFEQSAANHLRGRGCAKCGITVTRSKGEKELAEYIKSIYSGEVLENTRKFIGKKELDVYLPELKLALEYNGDYHHAVREKNDPGYHERKRKACKNKGIKLIEIWDTQWSKNKKEIKKNILKEIKVLSHQIKK